jgi:hypothetical protein
VPKYSQAMAMSAGPPTGGLGTVPCIRMFWTNVVVRRQPIMLAGLHSAADSSLTVQPWLRCNAQPGSATGHCGGASTPASAAFYYFTLVRGTSVCMYGVVRAASVGLVVGVGAHHLTAVRRRRP